MTLLTKIVLTWLFGVMTGGIVVWLFIRREPDDPQVNDYDVPQPHEFGDR
jgi:hypothetical protein